MKYRDLLRASLTEDGDEIKVKQEVERITREFRAKNSEYQRDWEAKKDDVKALATEFLALKAERESAIGKFGLTVDELINFENRGLSLSHKLDKAKKSRDIAEGRLTRLKAIQAELGIELQDSEEDVVIPSADNLWG